MRVMRRGLMVCVCMLLCCIVNLSALAGVADNWLVFGNEKDIVQDLPEDQRVVFEELMEFLGIAPPYYDGTYIYNNIILEQPYDLTGAPYIYLDELVSAFPNYKAIRFYPQMQFPAYMDVYLRLGQFYARCNITNRYIAYDCTDGSTVFCTINWRDKVNAAYWIHSRCTPEEFQAVQVGMVYHEVAKIDPNTDLGNTGSSGPMTSWHLLSDDTIVRITYKDEKIHTISYYSYDETVDYYSSYEAAFKNGLVEESTFGWLNPADLPD